MIFIFKKRFSTIVFSVLFFVLIVGLDRHSNNRGYAFLADTWVGSGGGKDYRAKDMTSYLVRVPDGNRAWRASGRGIYSPDGQKEIVRTFEEIDHNVSIFHVLEGVVQNLRFEPYVRGPFVWSPDSKYIALAVVPSICNCMRYPLDIAVVDTETGDRRTLTREEFYSHDGDNLAWSPDGKFIAYTDRRFNKVAQQYTKSVKIVPIDGSQPPRILYTYTRETDDFSADLRWLPDGKRIAVTTRTGVRNQIWYLDAETGDITYYYTWPDYPYVCWSPTTDHFFLAFEESFELVTPDGLEPLDTSFIDPAIWLLPQGSTTPCAWSPDGSKLVLVYSSGQYRVPPGVRVIDFNERQVSDIQVSRPTSMLTPYWSPDSRMLALKTYEPSRDPNDVYIYDMTTMQQVLFQEKLEFIDWLVLPPQ